MNAPELRPPDFLVFSDDWGGHPSSAQHLFRRIAGQHRVLWVNTVGMRAPRLSASDLRKVWRKVGRMLAGRRGGPADAQSPPQGLAVCQPPMLPFLRWPGVRRFNRLSVRRTVNRRMRELGMRRPVLVSSVPNASEHLEDLDTAAVVYYCVDDFSQWPGLESDLVRGMEAKLVDRADLLLATSAKLREQLASAGREVRMLPHGVDLDLFGRLDVAPLPALSTIPAPRVGFFGLIDERLDQDLVAALAARLPALQFVLAGPVVVDTSRLQAVRNVHFTGAVPYTDLPALVQGMQALMLPYLVNDFTATIAPLKFREYLATGLPVVSAPLPEACALEPHVVVARDAQSWAAVLGTSPVEDRSARILRMRELLREDTWDHRAAQLLAACREITHA